jgi:hypothetical protein
MYFAKHETFHIRDGWLYKGLDAIEREPSIFMQKGAPEELGIGKNMVRALRFWMQATGLTYEKIKKETRSKEQLPTRFGATVRQHDPYLEEDGTSWLIHYHLVTNADMATTWYWFFNHYAPFNFTRDTFIKGLERWVGMREDRPKKISINSFQKDFDCLTRTYLPGLQDRSPEDQLECPLTELGLLTAIFQNDREGKRYHHYRLEHPDVAQISPWVFLYILLDRQEKERPDARQVTLDQVLREAGNVGRVLNISSRDLDEMLSRMEDQFSPEFQVRLVRTGGLDQLTLPDIAAESVLYQYYTKREAV